MAEKALCSVENCGKTSIARGLCPAHYQRASVRFKRDGIEMPPNRKRKFPPPKTCAVEGCDIKRNAYGYCSRHAYHFKVHGDPLGGRRGASPGEPLRWIKENINHQGDDCLKWPFETGRYGYGTIKIDGKKRVASRVMCEFAHGDAPTEEHQAAHSCGNGHLGCMNPRHLSWKTRVENAADAIDHGTWNHGEKVPQSKLTRHDVLKIRALSNKVSQKDLAKRFGVSQSQIHRVVARKDWAWLDPSPPPSQSGCHNTKEG